nr:hypothetical protein [uncultured Bacillus sp.]
MFKIISSISTTSSVGAGLEAKELFQSMESEHVRKNEYYDSNHDIALFQSFQSQDSTAARVMKDKELNWGFYLPYYQKWVDYNDVVFRRILI